MFAGDILEAVKDSTLSHREGYDRFLDMRSKRLERKGFRRSKFKSWRSAQLFENACDNPHGTSKARLVDGLSVDGVENGTAAIPYYLPAIFFMKTTLSSWWCAWWKVVFVSLAFCTPFFAAPVVVLFGFQSRVKDFPSEVVVDNGKVSGLCLGALLRYRYDVIDCGFSGDRSSGYRGYTGDFLYPDERRRRKACQTG